MRLGAESSKKTLAAVALFVVAMIMTIRTVVGSYSSPGAEPAAQANNATQAPVARTARRTPRASIRQNSSGPVTPNLDPRLRLDALKEVESITYSGDGRNIFMAHAEPAVDIPTPKAPAFKESVTPVVSGPPVPPPPPPINLKFFGFASQQGSSRRIFLSSGEDIFVAAEGDIVQRRYRIVKIYTNSVEVQDVLSNNRQTIPLTAG